MIYTSLFTFFIIFFIYINKSFYKKLFILFISLSFSLSFFLDTNFYLENFDLIIIFFILHCLFFTLMLPNSKIFVINEITIHPFISKIMFLSYINIYFLAYIIFYTYSQLSILDITIGEFKNGGIASEVVSNSYVKYLLLISRVLSPFGYLALFILILKLISNDSKHLFYYLFISFNIPLIHLVAFSRSFVVLYFLFLLFIFIKYYKCFPPNLRAYLSKRIPYLLILIATIFLSVTYYRFESMAYWGKFQGSSYDNVIIFSLIYYFSSWIKVSISILSDFTIPLVGVFHDFLSLPIFIINKFNYAIDLQTFDYQIYATEFKGLFVSLLFDQGILFFMSFLIFIILMRIYLFNVNNIKFELIYSIFAIFMSVSFFFGNLFVYVDFVLAFVYFLFLSKFISVK